MTESLADIAAVMNNDNFGNGSWFWIVVLFLFGFGNGNWGGNQSATSTQVQNGFDTQNIMTRFDSLAQNQASNAMDNANLINQNRYDNAQLINQANINNLQAVANLNNTLDHGFDGIERSMAQNTYDITAAMNAGFNGINQNLCGLSHQISDGVCAIKTQLLQDKYDALLNEYNLSTQANANAVQTQTILGQLGKWYANPPYAGLYGTTTA